MFKEKVEKNAARTSYRDVGTGFSQAKYLVTEFCVVKNDVFT